MLKTFLFAVVSFSLLFGLNAEGSVDSVITIYDSNKHAGFPAAAKLQNGDIVAAFREGVGHAQIGGVIKLTRSTDGGFTWSEPVQIISDPNWDCRVHIGMMQLSSGKIILSFYKWRPDSSPRVNISFSHDNGVTWIEPQYVDSSMRLPAYGEILEFGTDTLLFPIYALSKTGVLMSNDGGETWGSFILIAEDSVLEFNETSIVYLGNDSLVAMIRSKSPYYFYKSISTDRGYTWTTPVQTSIRGTSPSLRVKDNTIIFCYRWHQANGGMAYRVSTDNGETWGEETVLYQSEIGWNDGGWDCAYPNILILENNIIIYIYYTAEADGTHDIEGLLTGITGVEVTPGGDSMLRIAPNPFSKVINICAKGCKFALYNKIGSQVINGRGNTILADELPSGAYFLQIDKKIYKLVKISQ